MKLYIYDHCPFCARARMIFGLRDVPVEEIALLNDDEATPIGLIGAKMVPILQKPDGAHMGESLDIVRFIDDYAAKGRLKEDIRPEVQAWFDKAGGYVNKLVQPRDVKLGLPEFATPSAIDYFMRKKEQIIGNFETNLKNTDEYIRLAEADLSGLATLVQSPAALGGELGMEDIIVFPILRNLTMVRGLEMPPGVLEYVRKMSELSKVPLYFDRAL